MSQHDTLTLAAKQVINHWQEFGPESGFDEIVYRLEKALSATQPAQAKRPEWSKALGITDFENLAIDAGFVRVAEFHGSETKTILRPPTDADCEHDISAELRRFADLLKSQAQQAGEVVGEIYTNTDGTTGPRIYGGKQFPDGTKLYTTPQAALLISDLELRAIYEKHQLATADIVISDLRRILIDAQGALLAKLQATQEPVAWRVSVPDEPELGSWLSEEPGADYCRNEPLYTGRTAAQEATVKQSLTVEPVQAGELPDDSIPAIGCGFWIDKISVENLRRIHRSESATAMISALINATDAIEDAQALIATLRAALSARKPLTDEAASDEVIELSAALERRRILEGIKAVAKIHPADDMPTPFQSAWAGCCEEIFYMATENQWHMDEDATRFNGINGLEVKP